MAIIVIEKYPENSKKKKEHNSKVCIFITRVSIEMILSIANGNSVQ